MVYPGSAGLGLDRKAPDQAMQITAWCASWSGPLLPVHALETNSGMAQWGISNKHPQNTVFFLQKNKENIYLDTPLYQEPCFIHTNIFIYSDFE